MCNIPLLHFRGRDVNTVGLASTAHREVDIEGREIVAEIALWDDVERSRVVEDMIIQREVAAKMGGLSHETDR